MVSFDQQYEMTFYNTMYGIISPCYGYTFEKRKGYCLEELCVTGCHFSKHNSDGFLSKQLATYVHFQSANPFG